MKYAGSRASWKVKAKVHCYLCSALGLPYELQSNLHMVATCAGPEGTQERPRNEPRLAATNAGLGTT